MPNWPLSRLPRLHGFYDLWPIGDVANHNEGKRWNDHEVPSLEQGHCSADPHTHPDVDHLVGQLGGTTSPLAQPFASEDDGEDVNV